MKIQQKKELQAKTKDELIKELRDLRHDVAKLKIDLKTGKVEDLNIVRKKKKDIARVMTYLTQKRVESEATV